MNSRCVNRRHLIRLAAGAAAWPFALRAENAAIATIGFLDPRSSPDTFADQIAGFHRGLKDIGFVDKVNVAIEYAWGEDQFERLPALAAELVRRPVAVIVACGGSHLAMVAKSATTTIPIVFAVAFRRSSFERFLLSHSRSGTGTLKPFRVVETRL